MTTILKRLLFGVTLVLLGFSLPVLADDITLSLNAECICRVSDGKFRAFFAEQPSSMPDAQALIGKRIVVTNIQCQRFSTCSGLALTRGNNILRVTATQMDQDAYFPFSIDGDADADFSRPN